MNIAVIGTGYVGLTIGACLAELNHHVICVDNHTEKIEGLNKGIIPFYEPNLEETVKLTVSNRDLEFTTDLTYAVQKSEVCFVAVGTPQADNGSADMTYITEAMTQIAKAMNNYKVIVIKSTVPPKTNERMTKLVSEISKYPFHIVSNPEFLRQGNAVRDFLHPDRAIIGSDNKEAAEVIGSLYAPITKNIFYMNPVSAELTKYAANSFLATKISFINEISNLCKRIGANIKDIEKGIGSDHRIGREFLSSGLGYGGSCFPKDIRALIYTAESYNADLSILRTVDEVNTNQKQLFLNKIYEKLGTHLSGKTIAVWGLSFKPNTDDLREAPSLYIVNSLVTAGATVKVYDPKVKGSEKLFPKVIFGDDMYSILKEASALIVLTEWEEFKNPDFKKVTVPVIFDGRHIYNKKEIEERGIEYYD